MLVYRYSNLDLEAVYLERDIELLLESIQDEIEDLVPGDSVKLKFECLEMSEDEYKVLRSEF